MFLFKYLFAKSCIPYPKAIFIHRFLLNKRETQVLANKFFGVKLSAETDYKFYIMLFQTTKIQISQINSQQIVAWVLYVVMLGHCVSQSSYNTCAENSLRLIVKCNHLQHTCCQLVRTTNGFHSSEVVNVRFIVEVIDFHTIQILFFILSLSLLVSFLTYHHD